MNPVDEVRRSCFEACAAPLDALLLRDGRPTATGALHPVPVCAGTSHAPGLEDAILQALCATAAPAADDAPAPDAVRTADTPSSSPGAPMRWRIRFASLPHPFRRADDPQPRAARTLDIAELRTAVRARLHPGAIHTLVSLLPQ